MENVFDRDFFVGGRCGHPVSLAMHGPVEARHTGVPAGESSKHRRRHQNKTGVGALQERKSQFLAE